MGKEDFMKERTLRKKYMGVWNCGLSWVRVIMLRLPMRVAE
jgi:hypothetical protein